MRVRVHRQRVGVPGATVVVFVLSVLFLLRIGRGRRSVGAGFGMSMPLWARRTSGEGEVVNEDSAREGVSDQVARRIGIISGAEQVSRALERAASGEGAVGPATTIGDRAVIPLLETFASGGFGGGAGAGTEGPGGGAGGGGGGGGGGGTGRSRAIAVVIVEPEGVRIRPVVDLTGLALPAASAVAALLLRGAGRRRWRRRR